MRRILDAKYEKYDLNEIMTKQTQHITDTERYRILHILNKFVDQFNGTLVTWAAIPVYLKLNDNVKPV